MNKIGEILGNFYILFIAITIFLILALIGYFIDQKHPDEPKKKVLDSAEELEAKLANAKGKTFSSAVKNDNASSSLDSNTNNSNI